MATTKQQGSLSESDIWVDLYSEPYCGAYGLHQVKRLGVGDHVNPVTFQVKSCRLSPGAQMILDEADVLWLGGLSGRQWSHWGYLDKPIFECSNGGRPSRVRVSKVEGPAVCLWRDDRYNGYKDVVTFDPGDYADSRHMQGRKLERWGLGYTVEDDCVAEFYSYSHGGGGDPAPLTVQGPADGRFSQRWSGDVSAIKRVMAGYKLVGESYDWGRRTNVRSERIVSAGDYVQNQSGAAVSSTLALTVSEGTDIEIHYEASLTAGVSVEVSGGVKPLGVGADVAVTASVEATASAGGGRTRSESHSVEYSAEVQVPPRSKQRMIVELTRESCDVPWTRTYRRSSDGFVRKISGTAHFNRLFQGRKVIEAAVPLG